MNRPPDGWFATVLKSIADGVIATDADARVVFMNRAAEELTGWDAAEATGRPVSEVFQLIDERTGRREAWPIREALARGEPVRIPESTLLTSRSGRTLSVDDIASPVRDETGAVTGAVVVFRDVTAKRAIERAVSESEARFRALLRATSDVVYRMSPDWSEMRHLEGREFIADTREPIRAWLERYIHPDDRRKLLDVISDSIRDKTVFELEHRVLRVDGSLGWTLSRAVPVSDDAGNIVEWVGAATDITERKRAEEELARRARELQAIYDAAPVGINISHDRECRVITGNRLLAEMLGLPPGENASKSGNPGKATYVVLSGERELQAHELPMQRAAADGIEIWDQLIDVVRADGTRINVLMSAKPIRDGRGNVTGAVGVCVDVTRLREVEDALRLANQRKDEFLAMLAHELRNPLAAVANAATVLKMSDDPENVSFAKDVVERQSRQLGRLIDDLLDVSRITSGKIRLRRELCDAGTILKQAVESVEPLIKERKHRLVAEFEEGTLPLRADPTRIEQIVVNLLTNAAKYTESGGRIRLSAARDGEHIAVTVEDNGMGIPPEKLPQMFELFAQGERSIARSEGGLGIGLTIVQKLSEMHGGSVSARSDGPGKGSVFTVRLPMASRPAAAATAAAPSSAERRVSRILVVDDNADTAGALMRLLKLLGNDVQAAPDGPSAIEAARAMKPDFVLLDIGLPGMDGYEVARRLREEPCCRATIIVAVSGYGQDEDRRRSREAGFDHHLVKPVDFNALISLIGNPQATA